MFPTHAKGGLDWATVWNISGHQLGRAAFSTSLDDKDGFVVD